VTAVHLGLFLVNANVCATDPAAAARIAVAAEAAGWESVWTGEHYALPDPPVPESPAAPDTPMLDPFVALAHLAAHTRTLRLGTGVTVVPLHHPLVLAKQVVSIDRVSGGRFLFGVGVGYLEPEFRALGVSLSERAARMDEHLDAIRAAWTADPAGYAGRHVSFAGVRAEPRPLQPAGPPLHVGGYVASSYRRAVTQGRGWYGFALDLGATERAVGALRAALDRHERPPGPRHHRDLDHPTAQRHPRRRDHRRLRRARRHPVDRSATPGRPARRRRPGPVRRGAGRPHRPPRRA